MTLDVPGGRTTWSWSQLVLACEGDEERALAALWRMPGLGEYEDEAHPAGQRIGRPVDITDASDLLPEQREPHGSCRLGHPKLLRNGRDRWVCGPCDRRRRAARGPRRHMRRAA